MVDIIDYIGLSNIMDKLDEEKINYIYSNCYEGYCNDVNNRQERNDTLLKANEIAMQVIKEKTYPWRGCANVKLPIITTGAIDFASKIYPAIMQDNEIVKCKTIDISTEDKLKKLEAGERLSNYLNYQLTEKMPDWKENEDMLTYALPINGIMLKKVYYDVIEEEFRSDLIFPMNFFTPNETREIDKAERATHVYQMSTEDIISSLRYGVFAGIEEDEIKTLLDNGDGGTDNEIVRQEDKTDSEKSNIWKVCEQHCWIDLDDDGYREPYIVTFIPNLERIVRITVRFDEEGIIRKNGKIVKIKPIPFFTKYSFLQSPDGSFYSLGLGELLLPINEAINTLTNQLLDAGKLNNMPAGLISKSAKIGQGDLTLSPGEFKVVNSFMGKIADQVMLLPTKEPSATLFELLKTLMASAKEIASIKDLTNTDFPSNSSVITTLSIIENGMSPFKAIYKRFHSALTKEIQLLSYWMKRYANMEEYAMISGKLAVPQDFDMLDIIIPVSDPSLVTSTQKMGRAQFLGELLQNPVFDPQKVSIEMVSLMGINPMPLLAQPQEPDPIDQQLRVEQLKNIQAQTAEIMSRTEKNVVSGASEMIRANSEDTKRTADSILALANAESKEIGEQNQKYIKQLEQAKEGVSAHIEDKLNLKNLSSKELPEKAIP